MNLPAEVIAGSSNWFETITINRICLRNYKDMAVITSQGLREIFYRIKKFFRVRF